MPAGGFLTIDTNSVATAVGKDMVEITVTDTGPGIPDKELNNIFEPLYSTKTYGIGLGLSIVKQIMEQHSGGISISSHSAKGACVKLWFPPLKAK